MAGNITAAVVGRMLDKTLGLKGGESITVETWDNGLAFALEVVRQARRRGAFPVLLLEDEGTFLKALSEVPKEAAGLMGKHERALLSASDCYVFIPGPPLGAFYKGITRAQYADSTRYNQSWYKAAEKAKLRGVRLTFGYVGRDLAKLVGKREKEVVAGQLDAAMADLGRISETVKRLASRMRDGRDVVVRDGSSRLTLTLKGEMETEDGIVDQADVRQGQNVTYLPPGYVLKGVAKGSASGRIAFSGAISTAGRIEDGVLELRNGRLKAWSSAGSADAMDRLLTPLKNKARLEYFAIGVNPRLRYGLGLDRFVKGAASFYGLGFTVVCKKATVSIGGRKVVEDGKVLV
jgi:leucyl aminopeptidase (aminopeptidase T)